MNKDNQIKQPQSGVEGEALSALLMEGVTRTPMDDKINEAISKVLNEAKLEDKAQQALEKAIREIIPSMAEKMIKEEIERLTK